ncbi:MAG: spore coat protein U domain-containing protein [Acidocella sp.]|nr:spore coat protein U domain-containing protein [Acidocella sp.]
MFMMERSVAGALLMLCMAVLTSGTAHASQCTTSGSITITATTLAFGIYDPTNITPTPSTTTITVRCTNTGRTLPPLSLAISAGDSGSFTPTRYMKGSAAGTVLNYQLYDNSTDSTVWGDGTGGTGTLSGGNGASYTQAFTGYGQIPVSQYTTPGSYTDTLTVTLTY